MKKTPAEILMDAAELFEKKNKEYGDGYSSFSELMFQLLGPVELKTVEDFKRFNRIGSIMGKVNRYAKNFSKGGHEDSATDLVVYAAILKELDGEESK